MLKFLFVDIDGALTDGYIYISTDKKGAKKYFRKDISALAKLRQDLKIVVIGLNDVDDLCDHYLKDFGVVDKILVGPSKVELVKAFLLEYGPSTDNEVIYIGDDIRIGSIIPFACPKGSELEVAKLADFHCSNEAGHGAVAEYCDGIMKAETWKRNNPQVKT